MVQTAFIYHPDCELHLAGEDHPEHPSRLQAIGRHLANIRLDRELLMEQVNDKAQYNDLLRVHHPDYLQGLSQLKPEQGHIQIDQDTRLGPNSQDAMQLAAGAGVMAVKDIMAGAYRRAFCAVRPPGHHAESNQGMGFCFLNNIAIAAQLLRFEYNIGRIAIIDFDVHHANGTADIFKKVEDVLLLSSFEHPHYPDRLTDLQQANMVFSPLAAGATGEQMRTMWTERWLPALEAHQPEFIFISAGFDAHEADPMAHLCWHSHDYYWLTEQIVDLANRFAQGRILSMLEGGYHLQALSVCVEKHLLALMERPYDWTGTSS